MLTLKLVQREIQNQYIRFNHCIRSLILYEWRFCI